MLKGKADDIIGIGIFNYRFTKGIQNKNIIFEAVIMYNMNKIICTFLLLTIATISAAQQGGRIGVVGGVAFTAMQNADDQKAGNGTLQMLPTFGFQTGLEFGYSWRYIGVSAQLIKSQAGQRYNFMGQTQETRLNYVKPTLLIHFNSNPKETIRFSGFIGGAYGVLTSYKEISQITNPITKAITYTTIHNTDYTIQDTGIIQGTLSNGIYYKSDALAVAGLGIDCRVNERLLLGIHARMDFGLEKLENYDKIKQKFVANNVSYTYDYEYWRNRPSKYDYQTIYEKVRPGSNNLLGGLYVSLKYILASKQVREYERYGY
jgi:Outer membrane protein beta-barrel domain